jgi:nucleoside-diphosphate-sugar epimerase
MIRRLADVARALIGHTGFVGGNLLRQGRYSDLYNSSNVGELAGRSFELVVSAGCKAAKWIANQEPEADRAGIERLTGALERVQAERFVLISTIDVYPRPIGVDEGDAPALAEGQPYGRHRLELERFVRARFPHALIVRLPGLFGAGLKKNAIYDFLHDNRLDLIHQDGVFQFYDLARIEADVQRCLAAGLRLVHFATEPVTTREVARTAFDRELENTIPPPAPRYDFWTRHASVWGRTGRYLATRAEVLAGIRRFVESERSGAR